MKIPSQRDKWVKGVLGVVCLVLVIDLLSQFGGIRVGAGRILGSGRVADGSTQAGASPRGRIDELAKYDPGVRLDLLEKFQSRPLPKLSRDPFGIEVPRQAPAEQAPAPPPQPPPPPPIPLKGLGYSENKGVQEGIVADDEQTYVVHQGETFAQRYRVLKLTPNSIEIEDESTHQTVQLPFAQ